MSKKIVDLFYSRMTKCAQTDDDIFALKGPAQQSNQGQAALPSAAQEDGGGMPRAPWETEKVVQPGEQPGSPADEGVVDQDYQDWSAKKDALAKQIADLEYKLIFADQKVQTQIQKQLQALKAEHAEVERILLGFTKNLRGG